MLVEETPNLPKGIERAGSAGLKPGVRRGDEWLPKHNFDGKDECEVDYDKFKDPGVPNRHWVLGYKGWSKDG